MKKILSFAIPLLIINIILIPLLISTVNAVYSISFPYWLTFIVLTNFAFISNKLKGVAKMLAIPLLLNFIIYCSLYFYNLCDITQFSFGALYKLSMFKNVNVMLFSNLMIMLISLIFNKKSLDKIKCKWNSIVSRKRKRRMGGGILILYALIVAFAGSMFYLVITIKDRVNEEYHSRNTYNINRLENDSLYGIDRDGNDCIYETYKIKYTDVDGTLKTSSIFKKDTKIHLIEDGKTPYFTSNVREMSMLDEYMNRENLHDNDTDMEIILYIDKKTEELLTNPNCNSLSFEKSEKIETVETVPNPLPKLKSFVLIEVTTGLSKDNQPIYTFKYYDDEEQVQTCTIYQKNGIVKVSKTDYSYMTTNYNLKDMKEYRKDLEVVLYVGPCGAYTLSKPAPQTISIY
jgi:hypothetical protein